MMDSTPDAVVLESVTKEKKAKRKMGEESRKRGGRENS